MKQCELKQSSIELQSMPISVNGVSISTEHVQSDRWCLVGGRASANYKGPTGESLPSRRRCRSNSKVVV
jgi:hypothetical protein